MSKRKIYTKPTMTILTMDTTPIMAAESIQADRMHYTDEAFAKEHADNGGGIWEDETSDD